MRAVLMVAVIFGLLAFGQLARASTFSDVPADHWAYEALDYLQQAGLVEGYPDGTFKGQRPFTRYEMAMVIARIFTKMQDWQASMEGGGEAAGEAVNMDEVNARLDRLAEEFRDELSSLGARVTAVEDEQAKMRDELGNLKALIKDSGLTGSARWRVGCFPLTGQHKRYNEPGVESYITLNYKFQPDPDLDFQFSLTSAELEGPSGSFVPGANNESGTIQPPDPSASGAPFNWSPNASSFVLDEAKFKYYFDTSTGLLGDCPTLTGGRQYFSEGEFGLAGDNGYRSNFGLRFDTDYGCGISAYAGLYRVASTPRWVPWEVVGTQSDTAQMTRDGDNFLLAGLAYHSGEASIPGHDYKLVLRADVAPNGYRAEKYISLSGNAELQTCWFDSNWMNGIRGEWLYVFQNAAGLDPDGDLGVSNSSYILELDVYNNGNTRVAISTAKIAPIEGLPVLANIDQNPFSEWDFTIGSSNAYFNMSREGPNYFPSNFQGFGLQAEHTFGNSLKSTFTVYDGDLADSVTVAGITDPISVRPGVARLNFCWPFTTSSTFGLDLVAAGERDGFANPWAMVRGEFKINF